MEIKVYAFNKGRIVRETFDYEDLIRLMEIKMKDRSDDEINLEQLTIENIAL